MKKELETTNPEGVKRMNGTDNPFAEWNSFGRLDWEP